MENQYFPHDHSTETETYSSSYALRSEARSEIWNTCKRGIVMRITQTLYLL
uniref:Uncharacterized protein n=1 Tax=Pyronema omphalodes (strain CBS 100304) TaxID=1076935 RepID=U4KUU9_PYROM